MMYAGEEKSLKGDMHAVPRVSVLMPLYNGKAFIEESLRSVQAQTFTDWEFIIVNDCGSDDGCADIVRAYAARDPRIRLIQCTERLGIAASLNKGLDTAVGDYVARVDVDDPSAPERLEKQVAFMDAHPELVLCSSWQRSVTPDRSYVQKVAAEREELKAAMLFGCEVSHCGVMLRREAFLENGWRYDPNYYGEDYELWLRVLAAGGAMENIPEPLVSHRWGFGNISLQKGEKLRREVCTLSARAVRAVGVDTSRYPIQLFAGWRNQPTEYARRHQEEFLRQGAALLTELIEKNDAVRLYDPAALRKVVRQRWSWVWQSCGLPAEQPTDDTAVPSVENGPLVSVVLPTFNSAEVISGAIDSVLAQTYTNWELLVINDDGSDDGTAEIVQLYGLLDSRVHLIQAESRLGLAESLNHGIRCAQGKYIARLDADDTSHPTRFAKQVALMESQPDVGICGTWQHHYGPNRDWVHRATADEQLLRCRLIFWCDLCHSTLMLRRSTFMEHELFFDNTHFAEDYELWTRAMFVTRIVNIPEALGEYYEGTSNITAGKMEDLDEESGQLSAAVLNRALGITLSYEDGRLLRGWRNPYKDAPNRREKLEQLKVLLRRVWEANQDKQAFDDTALLKVIAAKWHWAADGMDWKYTGYRVSTIDDALSAQTRPGLWARYGAFRRNNPSAAVRAKKIIKRLLRPLVNLHRKVLRKSFAWIIDELKSSVEHWTWNRYKRTEQCFQKLEQFQGGNANMGLNGYIPYYAGTKIRVLFVFQVASFWMAQEPLYRTLLSDARFDVKLVCYDEPIDHSIKTDTARKYLKAHHYDFYPWESFSLEDFNPHVVFLQTAYDTNRRPLYQSASLRQNGHRVVYVPYGIEIADTVHAHNDYFRQPIVRSLWKLYTFSAAMQQDYRRYLPCRTDVQATGLPRFDALYHRQDFPMRDEVAQRANGRPVVLWKVDFPKLISRPHGENILVTPDIREYIAFAHLIEQTFQDIFFVFMPHPRFKEFNDDPQVQSNCRELLSLLRKNKNVYIDDADDYRPSLLNADAIIVDRSTVMIEAAVTGVPILYVHNAEYNEPMTQAVTPLVESYYQGCTCDDLRHFVEKFLRGEDPCKTQREDAFRLCIPYFDGQCGQRIADDIVHSIYVETPDERERLLRLETELDELHRKVSKLLEEYGV